MRIVRERTAIASVSELRTAFDAILEQARESPVELERHNKPVAVLLDPKKFEEMQERLEQLEDILLAFEARDRERSARKGDYLSLEELERKLPR